MRYGPDELFDGDLPGHNISGTNITVSMPMNGTKYVCVLPAIRPNPTIMTEPAFLYIAGELYIYFVSIMYIHIKSMKKCNISSFVMFFSKFFLTKHSLIYTYVCTSLAYIKITLWDK